MTSWCLTRSPTTGTTNLQQTGGNTNGNNNKNEGGWSWNGLQHDVKSNTNEFTGSQQSDTVNYNFLRDTIILDSGSTIKATFMNPKFLTNIRKSQSPIIMQTNAGIRKIELEGDSKAFGVAKFDPDQRANIFGLSHIKDMYPVTMEPGCILVHTDKGIIRFERKDRLYCYTPKDEFFENVKRLNEKNPTIR